MFSQLLPDQIAVIGLCIFVSLSVLAFSKKKFFQNDEESSTSIKVQFIYVLAALFGLLLVRDEFAPIWGEMRFSYSMTYMYLALANIAGITLYITLSQTHFSTRKLLGNDGQIGVSRSVGIGNKGARTASSAKKERVKEIHEEIKEDEDLLKQAQELLNNM